MQIPIMLGDTRFQAEIGMLVRPIPGERVPSAIIYGWETGMVYRVTPDYDNGVDELLIKGIVNGREFTVIEFSDVLEQVG